MRGQVFAIGPEPLVSVVIPMYNCERYITKALSSVLEQSYKKLEIIVVDDGSLDGGRALVDKIDDHRLRVVERKNGGLAAARNTGINESKGELVAFLDADDWWYPRKIDLHVKHFQLTPGLGLSFAYSELVNENGETLSLLQMGQLTNITAKDIYLKNPIGNGSSVVINKAIVPDAIGSMTTYSPNALFDESLRQSEDIECWLRICLTTHWAMEGLPYILTCYRINQSGLSANLDKQYKAWRETSAIVSRYSPSFIAKYQGLAEAYYLRYLSRRSLSQRDIRQSLAFFMRALARNPLIMVYDPLRTCVTFAAIIAAACIPGGLYTRLERRAMIRTGRSQLLRVKARQSMLSREYFSLADQL